MSCTTDAGFPQHELDTPLGKVLVTVQGAHKLYVGAGADDGLPMIAINGVQYRLQLPLRRGTMGWHEAAGGWERALYRPGTYDNRPTAGAERKARLTLIPLIERLEAEMPGLFAAGQRAYLEAELARVRESRRYTVERLAEADRDIATLLGELGEPVPSVVVPAAVIVAMDRAWQAVLRFPAAQMCKHAVALDLVNEMERLGIAPPAEIIEAIVCCDDETALAWRREEGA